MAADPELEARLRSLGLLDPGGLPQVGGAPQMMAPALAIEVHPAANFGVGGMEMLPNGLAAAIDPEGVRVLSLMGPAPTGAPAIHLYPFERVGWLRFLKAALAVTDDAHLEQVEEEIAEIRKTRAAEGQGVTVLEAPSS